MSSEQKNQPISEYELQIKKNIEEMHGEFKDLFGTIKQNVNDLAKDSKSSSYNKYSNSSKRVFNSQKWQRVKMGSKQSSTDNFVRRSARIIHDKRKPINYNEQNDDSNYDAKTIKSRQGSLRIKFPFFKSAKDYAYYNSLADDDFVVSGDEDDDYFDESHLKREHKNRAVWTARLSVQKVTKEMIANIEYSSSNKTYDKPNGTTCHQCRQKTADQKSYCRYKGCRGIRGMFCGFCLGSRYGEDVAEVLYDEKWACPVCRNVCNCSICRRKQGMTPTGQMVQQAKANGFASVRHMLCDTEGEKPRELVMDDSDDSEDITGSNINESINDSDENKNNKSNKIDIQHNDIIVTDHQSKDDYENYDVNTKNTIYNFLWEQNKQATNNGNFSTSNGLNNPDHDVDGYLNSVEYVLKVIM